mmetsp:Transcript_9250/g.22912  ORF Transcript_9250/g.22912 Transcript_9250/m.22912 type:complete len:207 (+) Transcript_9250:104-724(+)
MSAMSACHACMHASPPLLQPPLVIHPFQGIPSPHAPTITHMPIPAHITRQQQQSHCTTPSLTARMPCLYSAISPGTDITTITASNKSHRLPPHTRLFHSPCTLPHPLDHAMHGQRCRRPATGTYYITPGMHESQYLKDSHRAGSAVLAPFAWVCHARRVIPLPSSRVNHPALVTPGRAAAATERLHHGLRVLARALVAPAHTAGLA